MKTFLYGASGHAKVIAEILEENNIEIGGVFDDNTSIKNLLDYKCYGKVDLEKLKNNKLIISIGINSIRKKIATSLPQIDFDIAIDKSANISKRATIGNGTIVMKGVSINSTTKIGEHCIINTNASIDHDCKLESFVHVSPNSALAGNVTVGEGTHIGTGVNIIPNLTIGKWCVIGAGAVIINDIPDYSVVVGNPGKIIKKNTI